MHDWMSVKGIYFPSYATVITILCTHDDVSWAVAMKNK